MEQSAGTWISISRRARRITLQRYLLSKLVYEKNKFSVTDLIALYHNQLWLEQKCAHDSGFLSKFGKTLEVISSLLKEINFRAEFTDRAVTRFSVKVKSLLEDFIFPSRNYSQVKLRYGGFVQPVDINLTNLERKTKNLHKRRIGIGYRDKGSLKNPAVDGSPSWQEVATHRGPLHEVPNGKKKKPVQSSNSTLRYVTVDKNGRIS